VPRIEDYALLGDLHSAALVSTTGSIDWLCLPRFDSPACFAALLHTPEAGHWCIAPAGADTCTSRRYQGDGLVLETEWTTSDGTVRVLDFVPPRGHAPEDGGPRCRGVVLPVERIQQPGHRHGLRHCCHPRCIDR